VRAARKALAEKPAAFAGVEGAAQGETSATEAVMPNDEPVLDIERKEDFHRHLAGEIVAKQPYRRKDAWGLLRAVVDMVKLKPPPPPPASPKPPV
jgi:hypothetical protein